MRFRPARPRIAGSAQNAWAARAGGESGGQDDGESRKPTALTAQVRVVVNKSFPPKLETTAQARFVTPIWNDGRGCHRNRDQADGRCRCALKAEELSSN